MLTGSRRECESRESNPDGFPHWILSLAKRLSRTTPHYQGRQELPGIPGVFCFVGSVR